MHMIIFTIRGANYLKRSFELNSIILDDLEDFAHTSRGLNNDKIICSHVVYNQFVMFHTNVLSLSNDSFWKDG